MDKIISFINFYDLRKHIRKEHLNFVNEALNFEQPRNNEDVNVRDNGVMEIDHVNDDDQGNNFADEINNYQIPNNEDDLVNNVIIENNLREAIINMIARLHCNGSMTGTMIKSIIEEFQELLLNLKSLLKIQINSKFVVGRIVNEDLMKSINDVLDFDSSFDGFKTLDEQINSLAINRGYIKPIEIPLGKRVDTIVDSLTCCHIPTTVMETCQYVL